MLRLARVVTVDLLINRVRSTYNRRPLPAVPKGVAPRNCKAPPPDSDPEVWRSSVTVSQESVGREFRSCLLLSCLALLRGLAMSRQPILRRAQAREGEAEK